MIHYKKFIIRHATVNDTDKIMNFIREYWKHDHIMATDKPYFLYEFQDGDLLNFIIAEDSNNASLQGIWGYIKTSSTSDLSKKDVWGSFWKVIDNGKDASFLGIKLAQVAMEILQCRMHIGNGANPKTTVPLRQIFFKDQCVKMKHYYRLNPQIDDFKIAKIKHPHKSSISSPSTKAFPVEIHSLEDIHSVKKFIDIEAIDALPYKDSWYVNKRYFNHPYYKYNVVGIAKKSNSQHKAIIVTRTVTHNSRKVLRIVDYIGNHELFSNLDTFFSSQLVEKNYEYVDFLVHGFEPAYIEAAGFVLRENDLNIIPNYFEPFVPQNIDIWAHYKLENTTFFKADGDQDRPNYSRNNNTKGDSNE